MLIEEVALCYLSEPIEYGLKALGVRLQLRDVNRQDEEVFLFPSMIAASL